MPQNDIVEFLRHPPSQRPEPERLFRAVEAVDGKFAEPVQFIGVHQFLWVWDRKPDIGFVEVAASDVDSDELDKLRHQRDELLEACRDAIGLFDGYAPNPLLVRERILGLIAEIEADE